MAFLRKNETQTKQDRPKIWAADELVIARTEIYICRCLQSCLRNYKGNPIDLAALN